MLNQNIIPHRKASLNRRQALLGAGALVFAGPTLAQTAKPHLKAIAFDGFAIFDARPVFALAESLFPGHGAALGAEWRTRIFEYTWLRTAAGQYADFAVCVDQALVFAASAQKLDLTAEARRQLTAAYADLKAFPDILPGLQKLKVGGLRLAILANPTPAMLTRCVENSALGPVLDDVISTDRLKTYKPDPRAYQLAVDSLRLKPEEIGFVASASWDAAGAAWFGHEAFWLNRLSLPPEQLGAPIRAIAPSMTELVPQLLS